MRRCAADSIFQLSQFAEVAVTHHTKHGQGQVRSNSVAFLAARFPARPVRRTLTENETRSHRKRPFTVRTTAVIIGWDRASMKNGANDGLSTVR